MSFNRNKYDTQDHRIEQSNNVTILNHILNTDAFEHKKVSRHQFGFVGGSGVSHISGNLIDLESDLQGITRHISKCDKGVFVPSNDGFIHNHKTKPIDTTMKHLPSSQALMFRSIPLPKQLINDKKRCKM